MPRGGRRAPRCVSRIHGHDGAARGGNPGRVRGGGATEKGIKVIVGGRVKRRRRGRGADLTVLQESGQGVRWRRRWGRHRWVRRASSRSWRGNRNGRREGRATPQVRGYARGRSAARRGDIIGCQIVPHRLPGDRTRGRRREAIERSTHSRIKESVFVNPASEVQKRLAQDIPHNGGGM